LCGSLISSDIGVTRLLLECLSVFSQCRSAMVAQSPYD
jgi:hypothetical protein